MFNIVPYKEEHINFMLDQAINLNDRDLFRSGLAKDLESRECFTGMLNGLPVVCGGILEIWPGRGHIWCVFNEHVKVNFIPVFRGIREFLKEQLNKFLRIEVSIPCTFEQGKRRALMLGFELECLVARKFLSDGTDCSIYSMVRN